MRGHRDAKSSNKGHSNSLIPCDKLGQVEVPSNPVMTAANHPKLIKKNYPSKLSGTVTIQFCQAEASSHRSCCPSCRPLMLSLRLKREKRL